MTRQVRLTSPTAAVAGCIISLAVFTGGCSTDPVEPEDKLEPKLSSIQKHVFDTSCSSPDCHGSKAHAGDLVLETGTSHSQLVGVAAANNKANKDGLKRVDTANVDKSFLLMKMNKITDEDYGLAMPIGTDGLDPAQLAIVKQWIEAGAKDD